MYYDWIWHGYHAHCNCKQNPCQWPRIVSFMHNKKLLTAVCVLVHLRLYRKERPLLAKIRPLYEKPLPILRTKPKFYSFFWEAHWWKFILTTTKNKKERTKLIMINYLIKQKLYNFSQKILCALCNSYETFYVTPWEKHSF